MRAEYSMWGLRRRRAKDTPDGSHAHRTQFVDSVAELVTSWCFCKLTATAATARRRR